MEGSTVLVTGAAQGIGAACAAAFHAAGAAVRALDRDFSQESEALRGLERMSRHTVDVADEGAVRAHIGEHGAPDVLVNCAGIVAHGSIASCSADEFRQVLDVNVTGTYLATRASVRAALDAGRALSIVNISSVISSISAAPDRLAYATSKAAMIGLTKSVALDFVRHGIRCNAVCPGTIDTPSLRKRIAARTDDFGGADRALQAFNDRQPIGRMGTAEEVADLVLFVASGRAGFMTGSILTSDGGFSL